MTEDLFLKVILLASFTGAWISVLLQVVPRAKWPWIWFGMTQMLLAAGNLPFGGDWTMAAFILSMVAGLTGFVVVGALSLREWRASRRECRRRRSRRHISTSTFRPT
jgi:hypothetical protein